SHHNRDPTLEHLFATASSAAADQSPAFGGVSLLEAFIAQIKLTARLLAKHVPEAAARRKSTQSDAPTENHGGPVPPEGPGVAARRKSTQRDANGHAGKELTSPRFGTGWPSEKRRSFWAA